jgi:hypothetical protein
MRQTATPQQRHRNGGRGGGGGSSSGGGGGTTSGRGRRTNPASHGRAPLGETEEAMARRVELELTLEQAMRERHDSGGSSRQRSPVRGAGAGAGAGGSARRGARREHRRAAIERGFPDRPRQVAGRSGAAARREEERAATGARQGAVHGAQALPGAAGRNDLAGGALRVPAWQEPRAGHGAPARGWRGCEDAGRACCLW